MNDTIHSRRIFLQRGMALLAAAGTVPLFLDDTAMAMADPLDLKRTQQASGKDGKILVVVQLSGGNDGLNTVVPFGDDNYYRERPDIGKKPSDVLRLNDYLGLNSNLTALKGLFDGGMMSIVQGVGYPNPDRSHFRSMDIWHTADPKDMRLTSGWLGRYFDATCSGSDPKNQHGPDFAVSLGGSVPLSMKGEKFQPLAFDDPAAFRYQGQQADAYRTLNQMTAQAAPTTKPKLAARRDPAVQAYSESDQLHFLSRTAMDAQISSDRILKATSSHQSTADYPRGDFGQGLRTVAAMIQGELPTRVYYVTLGGFDTHANQQNRHDNLMAELAKGIGAFWQDMKEQKNEQRVLMMTFSEFGRRVGQNGSAGTDHGTAAPMFLFGKNVKRQLIGDHPSLVDLDSGDLKFGIDFRNIYASVLQTWLDTPAKTVLGQPWQTIDLLKT